MSIQNGNQFFGQRKYDEAINAYNDVIEKYADQIAYPTINFREIVEALKNRGDSYVEMAKETIDTAKQKRYASKAIHDYNVVLNIGFLDRSYSSYYQNCKNGIDLMMNLLY
jgi:hypothetical protein